MKNILIYVVITLSVVVLGCVQNTTNSKGDMEMKDTKSMGEDMEFKQMCQNAGYEWMLMEPTKDGKTISEADSCWGCMIEGIEHVCDKEKFMEYMPQK